jgi:hypothetical protein
LSICLRFILFLFVWSTPWRHSRQKRSTTGPAG